MILHNDKKKNLMLVTTSISQKINKRTQIQSKIMSLQSDYMDLKYNQKLIYSDRR